MQVSADLVVAPDDLSIWHFRLRTRSNPGGLPQFSDGPAFEAFTGEGQFELVESPPLQDFVWLARMDLATDDNPEIGLVLLGEGLYRLLAACAPVPDSKFLVVPQRQPVYAWWHCLSSEISVMAFAELFPIVENWIEDTAQELSLVFEPDNQHEAVALDDASEFAAVRAPSEGLVDDRVNPYNPDNPPPSGADPIDYDARVRSIRSRGTTRRQD